MEKIFKELDGLTYKEWKILRDEVERAYSSMANKNALKITESMVKNVELEINL
ncbi:hypothetical protein [uncultured Ilyobacter sp.]|uniref:hypothetical protein n=1 Tax=uncultured Ilyobacter sp. TaxID=544433 RepID=UPI0029C61C8D|nr:hypothetical protein [uncultured Ilyobacter sp.]